MASAKGRGVHGPLDILIVSDLQIALEARRESANAVGTLTSPSEGS